MTVFFTFLFGAVFGSFFNVVGIRLPKKIPFKTGRSYCPTCKHTLHWFDLIPIFSYLTQSGYCRYCKGKISPIYPLVELLSGILFVFCLYKVGYELELLFVLSIFSMLIIIIVSDLHYMIIPDKILLFFLPFFIFYRILFPLDPWYDPLFGAIVSYGLIAIIILASSGGMGAGDMKLLAILGIVLGLKKVLLTFFIAAMLGAVIGIILLYTKRITRKQPIPFGPYIVAGATITYFFGDQLITEYIAIIV